MADTDTSPAPDTQAQAPPSIGGAFGTLADWAKQGFKTASPAATNVIRSIERVGPAQAPQPPAMPGQAGAAPAAPPAPPAISQQTIATSFIPPRATRAGSELGKPWWPVEAAKNSPGPAPESQFIPGGRDSYRYAGQVAARQAKYGAPAVAGPAQQVSMLAAGFAPLFDLISQGAFSRGFSEGNALQIQKRLGALKIQQEQFMLETERMHQAHQNLLLQYGDVFNAAEKGWIDPHEAERQIALIAGNNGDSMTQQQVQQYGLKGALAHLQREDAEMRTAMAASTSLKKAKQSAGERTEAEEGASLGYKTDISGQGMDAGFNFPGIQGDQGAGEQTARADTGTATDAGEEDTGDEAKAFEAAEQKKHADLPGGVTPEALQAGRDAYNGDFDPKSLKSGTYRGLVEGIASDYRNRIMQIAHGPGDQESKLAKISQLDPTAADKARGLLDYSLDPQKDIPAAHQARENLTSLAHAINPNWKSGNYAIVQKYHLPSSPEGIVVGRVSSLDGNLWTLNNVLQRIPEGEKIPPKVLEAWYAGHISGDPKWDELYTAIREIAADTATIQTGGRPAKGTIDETVRHMLVTNSPASLRAQAIVSMRAAYGKIVSLRDQFRDEIGDPNAQLPFLGKETNDRFLGYMRQNIYTGEMPSDAPQSLLAVGKKLDPKDQPPGMRLNKDSPDHPGDDLPPLRKDQIRDAWDQIDQYNREGTPAAQKKAQWLRERLGVFADRGSI